MSSEYLKKMRNDWNDRAIQDARFFIAFGEHQQSEENFSKLAHNTIIDIQRYFHWLKNERLPCVLEIGCGIGRLMKYFASSSSEIHGIDIADEMIKQGRERLKDIPNAFFHHTENNNLAQFSDQYFDIVYSFAVMQHLPRRSFFWTYFHESFRVLKPGGLFIMQFSDLNLDREQGDTWFGITISAEDVLLAAQQYSIVRSLDGAKTQYAWLVAQKKNIDYNPALLPPVNKFKIKKTRGALGFDKIYLGGPRGYITVIIDNFPQEFCDIAHLSIQFKDQILPVLTIAAIPKTSLFCIKSHTPFIVADQKTPIFLLWKNQSITEVYFVETYEHKRLKPILRALYDGRDMASSLKNTIVCGWIKVLISYLEKPDLLSATLGGYKIDELQFHCEEERDQRYQINLRVPAQVKEGKAELILKMGDNFIHSQELTIINN